MVVKVWTREEQIIIDKIEKYIEDITEYGYSSGDVFEDIMNYNSLSLSEACYILWEGGHIKLPEHSEVDSNE